MTAPRHRFAQFALSLCVAMAPCAYSAEAVPAKSAAESSSKADKARIAREKGEWTVEKGESLLGICRQLSDDPHTRRALSIAILEGNPEAFIAGDRTRIMVGAKLRLRTDLVAAIPALPAGVRAPAVPMTGPERAVAAESPSKPNGSNGKSTGKSNGASRNGYTNGHPSSPPEPAYVDQLIDGMAEAPSEQGKIPDQSPGQRFLSVEYRLESRRPGSGARATEQGIELRHRAETLNYGDFYIEGAFRSTDLPASDRSVSRPESGRVTLYHERFPLAAGWVSDSAIGVVRTPPVPLINSSYRIFLPTSIFAGASVIVSDASQGLVAYGGGIGQLEGSSTQSFDRTSGNIAGLGYLLRLSGNWTLGSQAVALRGSGHVADHESVSLAAERQAANSSDRTKLQAVVDSQSNRGGWFDGDVMIGRVRHRYGLFHLDPDLLWGDGAVSSDQRGAYWRGDIRMLGSTVSAGADLQETNLRSDPGKSKTQNASGYGTFTMRMDRNLSVGAGLTIANADAKFSGTDRRSLSGNAFVAWNNVIGLSRVDISRNRTSGNGVLDDTVTTLSLTQDFPSFGSITSNATYNYARESTAGIDGTRSSLGVTMKGSLFDNLSWDGSVVYGRIERLQSAEDNVNVDLNAYWRIGQNWVATALVTVNTFEPLPPVPGVTPLPSLRDKRFMVGLRYDVASGVPYAALGLKAGAGSGRIDGLVFYDENSDGVRQPGERAASNITVYLDGRVPATTDSDGRFSYAVVTPGGHRMRILNESLPLPWMLDDANALSVQVPLRGSATIEIPLTKVRP